jgi:ubiquinone/menaquinone biosynthesis C-methylase UbiE
MSTSPSGALSPAERHGLAPSALKSCCANLYELPITTLLLGPSFHPGGPALTKRLAEMAVVGRTSRVLDVASGRGTSALLLASHFGCEVVGVDYSVPNVQRANEAARQQHLDHRVRFVSADAEALPFEAGAFDVVLCECALCTFPNMERALSEMKRVLRPRGRVALSDIVLNRPVPPELDNVMGHVLCISGALSLDGYREALEGAAFHRPRLQDVSQVLSDLLDDIERRIGRAKRLAAAGELELPAGLDDPEPVLRSGRAFVRSGGVGYALMTARR